MDLSKFKKIGKSVTLAQKRKQNDPQTGQPPTSPKTRKTIRMAQGNHALNISQAKKADDQDKVEIFDKEGICVGYRIAQPKKKRVRHLQPTSSKGGKSSEPIPENQNQTQNQNTSTLAPKRIVMPKNLEGLHRTAAYTIPHRKSVLAGLVHLIETENITPSCSSGMDEKFIKLWYESCPFPEDDPMDFDLFVSYLDKIHKRSKSFAFSCIKPKSSLNFWLDLGDASCFLC